MTYDATPTTSIGSESSNASDGGREARTLSKPSVYKQLGSLFLGKSNVRHSKRDGIPELAAMIDSQGLLSPLQIIAELDANYQPTGRHEVDAGGRRYLALMHMVSEGKLGLTDLIECKEVDEGAATEVSLTENLGQQRMHPADEFTAFQKLVNEGNTIEAVAAKVGESVAHVKRRLRMAAAAPVLLEIYRAGNMTLDQFMALASVDDQERQVQTWEGLSQHSRSPSNIRNRLSEQSVEATDPRIKVIGLKNYLSAGGSTSEDLFTQGIPKTLTDLGLVEMMLGEVLQKQVDAVAAEGWAWVVPFSEFGYDERRMHQPLPKAYRAETQQEVQQRQALESKLLELEETLEALFEDEDADYADERKAQAAVNAAQAEIDALKETRVDFDAFDKTQCGAVVAFAEDAGIVVLRGMVERAAANTNGTTGARGGLVQEKAAKPEFPEKLMQNLSSHRTAAMQAAMLDNQTVSLAALANNFALGMFSYMHSESPLKISLRECRGNLKDHSDTIEGSRATAQLDAATAKWKAALPEQSGEWFAWFLSQSQATVLDFIVYAGALSTNAITGTVKPDAKADALAHALQLDMTQWWEASPTTYFDLVPKSKLAEIVRETSGDEAAAAIDKMKKGDAVAHAVTHTTGKGWLPKPLRPVADIEVESLDETSPPEGTASEE